MHYSATYSPDDNKLRLYASSRLDRELYDRVKAAGFRWAPKQELFVAPMWTPQREDLLLELAGEIGDEDTSLTYRAEQRADRFEDYRDKRTADAHRAREAVAAIADNIPLGQPILVGHHSEKHARRDAEKIENGMRKAVKMWETAGYWKARAAGALRHAKYKERPDVRARRIKTIEADKRRVERAIAESAAKLKMWSVEGITLEQARKIANYANPGVCKQGEGRFGYWNAYDVLQPDGERYSACPSMTVEQVQEAAKRAYSAGAEHRQRWIAHYDNRLTYERAMLEEAGATDLLKPKPRRELMPLLNYRATGGKITTENQWDRGREITYPQVELTRAEYAKINGDYRGVRLGRDKLHRFRTAMIKHSLVSVFLTDTKAHPEPKPASAPPPAADPEAKCRELWTEMGVSPERQAEMIADITAKAQPEYLAGLFPAAERAPDPGADFQAMKQSLKAGVQVVAAPQLFPTPPALAAQAVELAGIERGMRVLEPSAGTGALLKAIGEAIDIRALQPWSAVEINETLARALPAGGAVIAADFLELSADELGPFDRVVMNPPFANAADVKHIEHALKFLKPGGRLVAICANGPRQREKLKPIAAEWIDLPAGTFKDQGTGVNTALLAIDKGLF